MLTVKQILQTPGFEGITVLAGEKGLWRPVRTVTIIDAPDAAPYIKGGEIILSTLYIWKDDPQALRSFIEKVYENGSAAMGIKLKRFYSALPEEILQVAHRLDYPIFSYPSHFSFVDIINPVLSRIVNRQADILYRSMEIHRSLTDLSLETGETELIIKKLAEILGNQVAFVDTWSGKAYVSETGSELAENVGCLPLSELVGLYRAEEVTVGNTRYGYILLDDNPDPEKTSLLTHNALMHAKTVLKFQIKRDKLRIQLERKHRDEFLLDLLLRNIDSPKEISSRASIFGWDLEIGGFVLVASFLNREMKDLYSEETVKEKAIQILKERLCPYCSEVLFTTMTDSLILIAGADLSVYRKKRDQLKQVLLEVREEIRKETGWNTCFGIGSFVDSLLTGCNHSFENARKAKDIARLLKNDDETVIFWDEKGLYHFISKISESREGQHFYQACLEPLLRYDLESRSDLLETLLVICENNWNLRKAAEELHVHYNTAKYRFSRIKEIMSLNLDNDEERLSLLLALKLFRINNQGWIS